VKRTRVIEIIQTEPKNQNVLVKGWVRSFRSNRFIALNDGSTINNIQLVIDFENFPEDQIRRITVGSCIAAEGELIPSQGSGQKSEVRVVQFEILGDADPGIYPLQPKKHSLEFLREIAHLRFRTNTFGAIFRIRHHVAFAIHRFFHERGFFYLHSPVITASDAEGAGEIFHVTSLDLSRIPFDDQKQVEYKKDFFGRPANLTVSGQLEAELAAMALSQVYTFGPTFRAENSNTTRHLAEFWMIEPEVAFNDIFDNMDLAEDMLKYVIGKVMTECTDDLKFLLDREEDEQKSKPQQERNEMNLLQRLQFCLDHQFERVSYTDAIEILRNSNPNKKGKFQYAVESWGTDLQSEHERYLVEKHYKKPVILFNYPKDIKAFYMRQNDDGKTVAAMDILFPGIGEIVGGSQREERYDRLASRMKEMHIPTEEMYWYLDTRRFGSCPHAGFGLGFERLMLFITGMGNIRDVIPFPRYPGYAEF